MFWCMFTKSPMITSNINLSQYHDEQYVNSLFSHLYFISILGFQITGNSINFSTACSDNKKILKRCDTGPFVMGILW